MTSPFAADAAAIFLGPLAVDAVYSAGGTGPGVAIRCVPSQPDEIASFGASRLVSATSVFLVLVADVAQPVEGDTITVDGVTHTVQGAPLRGDRRLWWRIDTALLPED